MKLGMSINSAFKTALLSWASWVENAIDTNRTRVFFRTFESSHWRWVLHHITSFLQQPQTMKSYLWTKNNIYHSLSFWQHKMSSINHYDAFFVFVAVDRTIILAKWLKSLGRELMARREVQFQIWLAKLWKIWVLPWQFCMLHQWLHIEVMDTWGLGVTSHLCPIVAIGAYLVFLTCGMKFSSHICCQKKKQINMRGT